MLLKVEVVVGDLMAKLAIVMAHDIPGNSIRKHKYGELCSYLRFMSDFCTTLVMLGVLKQKRGSTAPLSHSDWRLQ